MKLSVENEFDKTVESLSDLMLHCLQKRHAHICDEEQCMYCECCNTYMLYYNMLADIDKLRVRALLENKFMAYCEKHVDIKPYRQKFDPMNIPYAIITIISAILVPLITVGVLSLVFKLLVHIFG